ncbi:MAG: TetR family transcriptional regulator [Rubritepida sp.]|nr:TetR family transcriptional regulator [Rubritepida sp.]
MSKDAELPRRARGRPQLRPDDETRRLVIEAARHEFHASGYARASMAAVAQRAGVSTKTMYRLIPTKAELFRSVVSERISRFILALDAAAYATLPIEEALERVVLAFGTLTLDEETIALYRLVLGESDRFPEIAATFYDSAVHRTTEAMEGWLRVQCGRDLIALDDVPMATGMLRGMMIMEPQRAVMMGLQAAPDSAEIAARAGACARLFLDGCRRAPKG